MHTSTQETPKIILLLVKTCKHKAIIFKSIVSQAIFQSFYACIRNTVGRSFSRDINFAGYKFHGPIFRKIEFRESVLRALPRLHN